VGGGRCGAGVLGSIAPLVRAPLFAEATLAGTLAVLEHTAAFGRDRALCS
jgi:hypothetical protein